MYLSEARLGILLTAWDLPTFLLHPLALHVVFSCFLNLFLKIEAIFKVGSSQAILALHVTSCLVNIKQ